MQESAQSPVIAQRDAELSDALAAVAELLFATSRKLRRLGHDAPDVVELTPLEAQVMQHIGRNPGTTPSRVAACIGLKSSNASAALRALERRGFIRREADAVDRRGVHLHPTRLAAENLTLMQAEWWRVLGPVLGSGQELTVAIDLLARIDAALDAAAAGSSDGCSEQPTPPG
ncbi:MarR family winged helix-turn-helix transcriptional regulator [Propionicicella superfundia]|uniref:MarR family winged helix-turn-helix transcriptional regulator n=1 Tax=Propionicicella superfundia TaxID=348582 RepID=UPI0004185D1D|nr:MarR family winged helix-turn-helix transcriptional regulator [Propionicicella superfundia]